MKCPYCAEEIKDEALVCRFCKQNLMSFKPVLDRLSQIEDQISDLAVSLQLMQPIALPSNPVTSPKSTSKSYIQVSTIVLPVLVSIGSYFLFRAADSAGRIPLIVSIVCPLPFGLWRGLVLSKTNFKTYAIIGVATGLVSSMGVILVYRRTLFPLPFDWYQVFSVYAIGGAFLYITGGIIGRWIEKKRAPYIAESGGGYAMQIAKKIVGKNDRSPEALNRVKGIAETIAALAPILTLIGSIITAYISYRATISKK